jgi:hypothetical protein
MSGQDVTTLQQILNRDPYTQVSDSGPGSPGQETAYFGAKTAQAVIRFQEKYASVILTPTGLTSGTGYVGSMTRKKLLTMSSSQPATIPMTVTAPATTNAPASLPTPVLTPATTLTQKTTGNVSTPADLRGVIPQSMAFAVVDPKDLNVFGLSHSYVRSGDLLAITGYGFDADTIIHFGPNSSIAVSPTSTRTLSVAIPSLSFGQYEVWASNSRGTSQRTARFYIVVGNKTDSRPTIMSVSPIYATRDSVITVTADKLSVSGNTVYSSLGTIRNIPSTDGQRLTFKVSDLPGFSGLLRTADIARFTLTFGVRTQDGMALNYGYFVIIK